MSWQWMEAENSSRKLKKTTALGGFDFLLPSLTATPAIASHYLLHAKVKYDNLRHELCNDAYIFEFRYP